MTIYKFSVGVVLAVAMVAVLGLSALVFSSRDFQFGVAQISPSTNGLISFAQLEAADRQIQQLESDSAGPRGELLEIPGSQSKRAGCIAPEMIPKAVPPKAAALPRLLLPQR